MKKILVLLIIIQNLLTPQISYSQALNWRSLKKEQKQIININGGVEYGLVIGAGYYYRLKSLLPVLLHVEYSFPGGKKLFDDYKTKIGGQVKLYKLGDFHFSSKFYGIFRRYESDFARLVNFGADLSATAGFYKSKWFVAAEAGLDKAIVTHIKHAAGYKSIYPLVKDGWYEPATGGNFYYGLQTGYSFQKTDIYIKGGKIITQDFQTDPLIPFSFQLGINRKISR